MGWSGYYMDCPKGKDRIAEVIRLEGFNWENDRFKDEVIASSMHSTTCYFVIRRTSKEDMTTRNYATVCLTQYDKKRECFLIKVMDETMGPFQAQMPLRMLHMLSETDNEWALEWRKMCEQNARKAPTSLGKLPMGTKLRIGHPYHKTYMVSTYRGRRAYIALDYSSRITAAALNRLGYEIVQ